MKVRTDFCWVDFGADLKEIRINGKINKFREIFIRSWISFRSEKRKTKKKRLRKKINKKKELNQLESDEEKIDNK